MKKYLFIVLIFFSCASNRKSAITEQEDFIKNHPNWKGHTFGFKERELNIDVFEVIEAINQEKKIQSIQDSIFVIDEKEKWYQPPQVAGFFVSYTITNNQRYPFGGYKP